MPLRPSMLCVVTDSREAGCVLGDKVQDLESHPCRADVIDHYMLLQLLHRVQFDDVVPGHLQGVHRWRWCWSRLTCKGDKLRGLLGERTASVDGVIYQRRTLHQR